MFAHIRKHQQWLFILIIAVVVVSFVIFFTPTVQYDNLGNSTGSDVVGSIDGRPVAQKEFVDAYKEVMLRFLLMTGQWPDQLDPSIYGFNLEEEAPNRLLLLDKASQYGIQVSDKAVAKWIVSTFKDPETNEFRRELYDGMMTNGLAQRRMDEQDFQRFAKNQIAVSQLTSVVGLTGELVSPREAEILLKENSLQANVQAVFFSSTNFANLSQDLEGLETFYTNRMALYRNPAKRTINYVKFAATNYLAEAETQLSARTNITEMTKLIYNEKGTNSFTENGVVLSEEAALEKIKTDELKKVGVTVAKEKAMAFARELYDIEPMKAETLRTLAEEKGLTPLISQPFTENQLIPNLGVQYQLTRQAFQLSEEEPFATPFISTDAVYIVSLNSIIPSAVPPLDEIRGRVTVDFYQEKSLEAARTAANDFHATLETQLAEGKSFDEICDEAGNTRVQMPLFARKTQSYSGDRRANLSTLKNLAFSLSGGEISEVSTTQDGAMILYVNSFVEGMEDEQEKELPDFIENLRQTRRSEAFSEWLAQGQATMNFATASDSADSETDGSAAN